MRLIFLVVGPGSGGEDAVYVFETEEHVKVGRSLFPFVLFPVMRCILEKFIHVK